jgi:hypothetical protein
MRESLLRTERRRASTHRPCSVASVQSHAGLAQPKTSAAKPWRVCGLPASRQKIHGASAGVWRASAGLARV